MEECIIEGIKDGRIYNWRNKELKNVLMKE